MKKKEKDESGECMSKAGKPDRCSFFPISWPLPDSKDCRNQGMYKTFTGAGELTEYMTATYWG